MNYLAHIYLSGEDEELKIGNFIADSVKGKKFIHYPLRIQKGIIFHRAIDTYTDTHPVVKKSVHRLFPFYSHYSAVIVDIYYDHFLAANWHHYSSIPLKQYSEDFYALIYQSWDVLPERVQNFLPFMERDNWLLSYATIEGIGKILRQMNNRTSNKARMDQAVKELTLFYGEFEEEFKDFFTDLEEFAKAKIHKI